MCVDHEGRIRELDDGAERRRVGRGRVFGRAVRCTWRHLVVRVDGIWLLPLGDLGTAGVFISVHLAEGGVRCSDRRVGIYVKQCADERVIRVQMRYEEAVVPTGAGRCAERGAVVKQMAENMRVFSVELLSYCSGRPPSNGAERGRRTTRRPSDNSRAASAPWAPVAALISTDTCSAPSQARSAVAPERCTHTAQIPQRRAFQGAVGAV